MPWMGRRDASTQQSCSDTHGCTKALKKAHCLVQQPPPYSPGESPSTLVEPPKNKSDLPLPPSQLSVAYDIYQK